MTKRLNLFQFSNTQKSCPHVKDSLKYQNDTRRKIKMRVSVLTTRAQSRTYSDTTRARYKQRLTFTCYAYSFEWKWIRLKWDVFLRIIFLSVILTRLTLSSFSSFELINISPEQYFHVVTTHRSIFRLVLPPNRSRHVEYHRIQKFNSFLQTPYDSRYTTQSPKNKDR